MTVDRHEAIDQLDEGEFDVLVIGGGVTGCGVALDAASRGLRTALVEAVDFGAGTSSRSSKMVHGGIRYLQQFEIGMVREALRERRRLLANAPHLVRKLPFILPVMRKGGPIPWYIAPFMRLVLAAYDFAGGDDPGWRHRKLDADETLGLLPLLKRAKIRYSYLYHDAWVDDARLSLALARTAALDHGAVVLNHTEVVALERDAEDGVTVTGARLRVDGREISVTARAIVNAAGVWAADVADLDPSANGFSLQPAIGVHVVVDRSLIGNEAAVVLPAGKSTIFAVPWGDHAYIGTTDVAYDGDLRAPRCTGDDVDYLLDAVNESITTPIGTDDVKGSWAGLRPLIKADGDTRDLSRQHQILVSDGGVISVIGGKLTTYRAMAEDVVDAAADRLGVDTRSRTPGLRLRGARTLNEDEHGDHLLGRHGAEAAAVAALADADADLAQPVVGGLPYLQAEVVWAVREELAHTVDDVLSRRLRAHLLDREGSVEAAATVGRLMGAELGWSPEREAEEVEHYLQLAQADGDALNGRAERRPTTGTDAWAPGLGRPSRNDGRLIAALHENLQPSKSMSGAEPVAARTRQAAPDPRTNNPWLTGELKEISHQGGSLDEDGFGQNTVAGYERGLAQGWLLDTDLRASADDHLVAFHDAVPAENHGAGRSIDLTGSGRPIAERDLADILENVKIEAPDGSRHDIATFADILALARAHPDAPLSVEPKTIRAAELLVDVVNDPANRDLHLLDRTVFYGMSDAIRDVLARGLGPKATTGLAQSGVIKLLAYSALSRLPGLGWLRLKTSAGVAALPHSLSQMRTLPLGWLPDTVVDGHLITPSVVKTARRSGIQVFAWTVDDPQRAQALVDRGVVGIYSDRPELVFSALEPSPS